MNKMYFKGCLVFCQMDYSTIIAMVGGMVLSQTINLSYKLYQTILENDRKRTESITQNIAQEHERMNALLTDAQKTLAEQKLYVQQTIAEQNLRFAQMVADVTSKVSTERGTYATYSGSLDRDVHAVETKMDDCSNLLLEQLKTLINAVEQRNENPTIEQNEIPTDLPFGRKELRCIARIAGQSIRDSEWVAKADAEGIGLVEQKTTSL